MLPRRRPQLFLDGDDVHGEGASRRRMSTTTGTDDAEMPHALRRTASAGKQRMEYITLHLSLHLSLFLIFLLASPSMASSANLIRLREGLRTEWRQGLPQGFRGGFPWTRRGDFRNGLLTKRNDLV